jgi:hypothetical protein
MIGKALLHPGIDDASGMKMTEEWTKKKPRRD